ncbi:uncharacterized protein KY384_003711 [Bacidia gigantensis]|uniref:uncharacterized protein n=1 Tax=Bacidia gigantensis TaxID=2732470 RepID=UPI001D03C856|nr:uncharacterized protein KY384_003711 [Bacidia gigantensis]KAG8532074.1 hypothetical protein KY384_003711 [Bacidia gigantensis]
MNQGVLAPIPPGREEAGPTKQSRKGTTRGRSCITGEVYQPTKRKPKTPRPSTEGEQPGEAGETSGPRKKVKKQKVETGPMEPPIQSLVEGSAHPPAGTALGEQMQIDTPERLPRSTIPETQASEFAASESLLRGMQEQAVRSDSGTAQEPPLSAPTQFETAQSSATLQQGTTMGEQQSQKPREMPNYDHETQKSPEATMS